MVRAHRRQAQVSGPASGHAFCDLGGRLTIILDEPTSTARGSNDERDHVVMFYDRDQFLVDSVVGFIAPALSEGRLAVVLATAEHRACIEASLDKLGIDVEMARVRGNYRPVDARELLSRLMVGLRPGRELFEAAVRELLDGATSEQPARVFGELVALLVADGLPEAALALEDLWNDVRADHSFSLLCGYPIRSFGDASMAPILDDACAAHSSVVPCESYSALVSRQAQLRQIAALQQKAAALERALVAEREARDAAEAALRIRDDFLSTASHELRTPITVLGVQAQTSLRRWQRTGKFEPESALKALRTVDRQADKLARLVNHLLDITRLESGKISLEPVATDLPVLIREVVACTQPLSDQHPISVSAPEHLERRVDPLRLEQVLMNLLDNAMKYSPDGARIEVSLDEPPGGGVHVAVRDFGPGIEPDERDRIFDRFYQAGDHSGRSGLGLGLYLSRSIVELHGGELTAEFPPDGGTRFVIRLTE